MGKVWISSKEVQKVLDNIAPCRSKKCDDYRDDRKFESYLFDWNHKHYLSYPLSEKRWNRKRSEEELLKTFKRTKICPRCGLKESENEKIYTLLYRYMDGTMRGFVLHQYNGLLIGNQGRCKNKLYSHYYYY